MCSKNDPNSTRYTLLARALDLKDQRAWEELLAQYERYITYLMVPFNIPVDDWKDVKQDILINLATNLHTYDREKGKFRSWCSRLIRNQCLMYLRAKRAKKSQLNAPTGDDSLANIPTASELDAIIDKEWQAYIVKLVHKRVASEIGPKVLVVFEHALAGRNTAEIAELTGFATNTVYHYQSVAKQAFTAAASHIMAELGDTDE